MSGWSEVERQDPWGPSHEKSGWRPTENSEWSATPTQEAARASWGRSDSRDAPGGLWGNDVSPGPQGTRPAKGGRRDNDVHGSGHQNWEEGEGEEGEEDGDSGWGDGAHWMATIQDIGDHRSHWSTWGRTKGGPPPPIPPSAFKKSHSIPQPSAKPQSARKDSYQDHAEALNNLLSTSAHLRSPSTHQRSPSHRSRPPSTQSQSKPLPHTSPWRSPRTAPSLVSSDGLSYADDGPPPSARRDRLPPQEDYFTPKSPYTPVSPSRILAAAMGLPTSAHFASPDGKDPQAHRFISSGGAALTPAYKALYSKTRRAQDRLHWAYNPDNDERVKAASWWIHRMAEGVGGFGVSD